MPTIVRWYVKTALLYLALSLTLGVLAATERLGRAFEPTYWHLFAVGWLTHIIFGIALWMLPSYTRERPRRSDALSWAVYLALNIGLLLRAVAEPLRIANGGRTWGLALALSAILQFLAALGFVINVWPRVRGPRRPSRQEKA